MLLGWLHFMSNGSIFCLVGLNLLVLSDMKLNHGLWIHGDTMIKRKLMFVKYVCCQNLFSIIPSHIFIVINMRSIFVPCYWLLPQPYFFCGLYWGLNTLDLHRLINSTYDVTHFNMELIKNMIFRNE